MEINLDQIAHELIRELRREVNPERREFVKGYAPTSEEILGVSVPVVRLAAKRARARVRDESLSTRVALAKRILKFRALESRQAAYDLLAKDARDLSKRQLEDLGRGIDNWATVDSFSTVLAGPAWIAGRLTDADLLRWAKSRNQWWRRAALASTVALNVPARGGNGDTKRTIAICKVLVSDPERLVQKAISWSLRSLIRWDPTAVQGFVDRHRQELPAFVIREVAAGLSKSRESKAS